MDYGDPILLTFFAINGAGNGTMANFTYVYSPTKEAGLCNFIYIYKSSASTWCTKWAVTSSLHVNVNGKTCALDLCWKC